MRYYLFRVGPEPYQYRIEKARGPRGACRLAFGVIYDMKLNKDTGVRYKDLGSRSPRYMTTKAKNEAYNIDESYGGWQVVPLTGD